MRAVDRSGEPLKGNATFIRGYVHPLYPPTRPPPGGLPDSERIRLGAGRAARARGADPSSVAWRLAPGAKAPDRIDYGFGWLPIPGPAEAACENRRPADDPKLARASFRERIERARRGAPLSARHPLVPWPAGCARSPIPTTARRSSATATGSSTRRRSGGSSTRRRCSSRRRATTTARGSRTRSRPAPPCARSRRSPAYGSGGCGSGRPRGR